MDFSTLWGKVPIPDAPKMPYVVPSTTILKVVVDVESEKVNEDFTEDTDKKELRDEEHRIVETLTELHETEEVILQAALERSLPETSEVGSSGVTPDSTIPHIAEMGTYTPIIPHMPPPVILLSGIDVPLETLPLEIQDESIPQT
uniref:Polyprotein protein n=1 Tax=Solanum tuberosum TaxID=4113 RepID=M1DTB6_SOLTU